MKKLDYLYYKIYRANLIGSAKDIAEFAAMIYVSGLLFANIFVIGAFLKKQNILPFFFTGKRQIIIFMACLFVLNYFLFLHKKRYKKIIERYEQENELRRKRGNLIVWLYVIITFLTIFAVAFYKPGRL
jgi:phosphatidylglycerophosphate synthase